MMVPAEHPQRAAPMIFRRVPLNAGEWHAFTRRSRGWAWMGSSRRRFMRPSAISTIVRFDIFERCILFERACLLAATPREGMPPAESFHEAVDRPPPALLGKPAVAPGALSLYNGTMTINTCELTPARTAILEQPQSGCSGVRERTCELLPIVEPI